MKSRIHSLLRVFLLSLAVTSSGGTASAQQIRTDSRFGQFDIAFSQITQSNGRVISGGSMIGADGKPHPALVGYTADFKSVDLTFGTRGIVILDTITITSLSGVGLALQPDGKILIGATLQSADGGDFVVARLLPNGTLDPAYGIRGVAVIDFQGSEERAYKVLLQPDGGLVIAGFSDATHPGRDVFALAKLNAAGQLDTSWAAGGRLLADFGGSLFSAVYALALDKKGNTIAGGGILQNGNANFAAFRMDTKGRIDSSFGQNGLFSLDVTGGGGEDIVTAIAVLPNNSIVFIGSATSQATAQDFALAITTSQGGLLSVITHDFGQHSSDMPFGVAFDPLGRIVVAGYSVNPANGWVDLALARFQTSGDLDTSFGSNKTGLIILHSASDQRIARALSVTSSGQIVVTGQIYSPSTSCDYLLMLLNANGTEAR